MPEYSMLREIHTTRLLFDGDAGTSGPAAVGETRVDGITDVASKDLTAHSNKDKTSVHQVTGKLLTCMLAFAWLEQQAGADSHTAVIRKHTQPMRDRQAK